MLRKMWYNRIRYSIFHSIVFSGCLLAAGYDEELLFFALFFFFNKKLYLYIRQENTKKRLIDCKTTYRTYDTRFHKVKIIACLTFLRLYYFMRECFVWVPKQHKKKSVRFKSIVYRPSILILYVREHQHLLRFIIAFHFFSTTPILSFT